MIMSFDEIYNENHKYILQYLNFKTNDLMISEELANDVFMRVHKHLDSYDSDKSSIGTWVMTIATRILIDHYRKSKLNVTSLDIIDSDGHDTYSNMLFGNRLVNNPMGNPHIEMVTKETVTTIQCSIVGLPKKYRRICNLFFNHQYKMKHIAEMTSQPLNTVKGEIHKARKILQKQLTR